MPVLTMTSEATAVMFVANKAFASSRQCMSCLVLGTFSGTAHGGMPCRRQSACAMQRLSCSPLLPAWRQR